MPPLINGDGEQTRDFTFVENVVQANIKALMGKSLSRHEVYNVAYGQSITLNELWKELARLAGTGVEPRYGPPREGDIRDSLADIGKAEKFLDYHPIVDVRAGLKISLDWYRENIL
jgi:UDP-N-acetylglucosamine 4-epimerase